MESIIVLSLSSRICLLVIVFTLSLSGTHCIADNANSAAASLVKRLKVKSAVDKNGNLKSELVKEAAKMMSGKEEDALAFAEAVFDSEDFDLMIVKSLVVRRFLESTLSENKEMKKKWLARLGEKKVHNPLFGFTIKLDEARTPNEKMTISLKSVHDSFFQAASADKVITRVRAIYLISMQRLSVGKAGRSKLLQLTRDPVAEVRAAAFASLFRCGVDPVILREVAFRGFGDKSAEVRSEAMTLIAKIRTFETLKWKGASKLLKRGLLDKSSLVRMRACSVLTSSTNDLDLIFRTPLIEYSTNAQLLPNLAKAIREAKSAKELNSYVSVLVNMPACSREVLLANLLVSSKLLKSRNTPGVSETLDDLSIESHQMYICYFALKMPPAEARVALPLIRSLRGNKREMARLETARGLLHIKSSDADRQWAKKTIYEALKKKRKPRWYSSYNNPYDYLQFLDPNDKKVVELWKGAFTHPSPHVRLAAIATGLKWKKKRQDAGALIRSLLKDREVAVRFAAAQALRSLGEPSEKLLKVLIGIMQPMNEFEKEIFDPMSGNVFISNDFDRPRGNVYSLLQEFGPAAASVIPALVQIIQKKNVLENGGFLYYGPENSARIRALLVLAAMGNKAKPALPAMLELLKQTSVDPWHNSERATMQVLAAIGENSHEAVPLLIKKLRESSPCLRLEAARTLGAIGSRAKAAIPVLRNLAPKSRPEVAEAINEAIKQINNTK